MLEKFFETNKLNVLGIYKDGPDDSYKCHILNIVKNKNKLNVINKYIYINAEDALADTKPNIPLIIVYDGKGVLTKKIDGKNQQDVVWKNNIDFNNIYYTIYRTEEIEFISFSRRSFIEDFLTRLKKAKIEVVDMYTGPLVSALLINFINKNKYAGNITLFEFENQELFQIEKILQDENLPVYNIDGLELTAYEIPLYAAALNYYIGSEKIEKSLPSFIDREEVLYKKMFNTLVIVMLAVIFFMMIISYGLTQYYLSQNATINEENVYSSHTFSEIQKLEAEKNKKIKILANTGQMSKNFMSFYAYNIAASVPKQVLLTNMEICPVANEIKNEKKIEINSNVINIAAISENEIHLNSWLKLLKKFSWIRTFEIMSIKKNKENKQVFEIKILIK